MNNMLKLLLAGAALVSGAGIAHAQSQGPPSSGPGSTIYDNPGAKLSGDTNDRDAARARDEAIDAGNKRKSGGAKTSRTVAARPEQVTVGSEVRDSKGVVIARIESVSPAFAVVTSDGGKIEVPLESFGMGRKGLMFGMPKAEFDALVASANKPAG